MPSCASRYAAPRRSGVRMKIFIETDMEGVAGVLDHDNWCQPAGPNTRGVTMTWDANFTLR